MKKIICFALLLCLLVPVACAESIDLDSLSFQELAALRDRIQLVMMQRDEWQEVTVPQGVYKVGEDIPAGKWVVKCSPEYQDSFLMLKADFEWGEELYKDGQSIAWSGRYDCVSIYNPNNRHYNGGMTEYIFTVRKGDYIIVKTGYNSVVFAPYTGKPNLGFK